VYLTDLTFIEDGCKDVVMQGEGGQQQKLVNFDKYVPLRCVMTNDIVCEVTMRAQV
jgi:hypothetical protein